MSLPRRLSLSASGEVQIEPAGDIGIAARPPYADRRLHYQGQ